MIGKKVKVIKTVSTINGTLYENDIKFIQLGSDIQGESSSDFSGWATSLSSDGY